MTFPCPLPAALTSVVANDCPFRFDQIVKMLFFQRQAVGAFDTSVHMKLIATWTPLLTAADATKTVPTPVFANFVIPDPAGQFVGGNDNTTFNGIREYYGEDMVTVTGEFKNQQPATITALQALTPFSIVSSVGKSDLDVMFVNKDGVIFYNTIPFICGFDCYNWRVGARSSAGLKAPDLNKFSFDLKPNWDAGLASLIPGDFDPLTALVNAA